MREDSAVAASAHDEESAVVSLSTSPRGGRVTGRASNIPACGSSAPVGLYLQLPRGMGAPSPHAEVCMDLLPSLGRVCGALVSVAGAIVLPAVALAQNDDDDITIAIAKHAELASDGAVIIRIHIACDPLPGTEDFQEAHAGAGQPRTGAGAEAGIDGTVVCDGTAHTHTAHLFPHTDAAFKRGPARANASLFICNVVEEQQICVEGRTQRQIIIRGPLVSRT